MTPAVLRAHARQAEDIAIRAENLKRHVEADDLSWYDLLAELCDLVRLNADTTAHIAGTLAGEG